MKWGFAWEKGPFEILDVLGPKKVIEKCNNLGIKLPRMLEIINNSLFKEVTNVKMRAIFRESFTL